MPEYRRDRIAGGCYFFTVNLLDPRSDLLVVYVDVLHEAARRVRVRAPFTIDAWVVLPDHMHCLWTLPEDDADFPGRWQAIKTAFAKALPGAGASSDVMATRVERARDYAVQMDYTHFNPVKHGYVAHAASWPHSSFRCCVAAGPYPAGWSGGAGKLAEAGIVVEQTWRNDVSGGEASLGSAELSAGRQRLRREDRRQEATGEIRAEHCLEHCLCSDSGIEFGRFEGGIT